MIEQLHRKHWTSSKETWKDGDHQKRWVCSSTTNAAWPTKA